MSDRKRRPFRITLFVILVLFLALWNGFRLGQAIFFWKTLHEFGASPWYIAISGGFWLLGGLVLAWGAWWGKPWAWIVSIGSAAGYGSWSWFDKLVIQKTYTHGWLLPVTTLILLALVFAALFSGRARQFFRKEPHGPEL